MAAFYVWCEREHKQRGPNTIAIATDYYQLATLI